MSPTIDPSKLKVTELREQLQARGLDVKGNKPVLVKRLKKALEEELNQELPNTSIADTSTEDDGTLAEEQSDKEVASDRKESVDSRVSEQSEEPVVQEEPETQEIKEDKITEPVVSEENEKTNGEADHVGDEENKDVGDEENKDMEEEENKDIKDEENKDIEMSESQQSQGEKRKRSIPSSDEPSKKVRPVIQEDEPEINPEKALLSWYDSDLYLKIDKQSFLSAQPFHDSIFGYAWAGVRATHGVKSGKVRYEVKLTEALKWEDYSNNIMRRERERQKESQRKAKEAEKRSKSKDKKTDEDKKEVSDEAKTIKQEDNGEQEKEVDGLETELRTDVVVKEEPMEIEIKKEKEDTMEEKEDKTEEKKDKTEEKEDKTEEKETEEEVPTLTHIFRVGWSLPGTSLQLGEDQLSYGYESTGKFAINKTFSQFGDPYKLGDVIGAFLNITDEALEMRFTINGELQPHVKVVPVSSLPVDAVIFPHVLTRNFAFELNLGAKEEPWFASPQDLADYVFLEEANDKVAGPSRPETRGDCEVLMMCGLPACGKTHWVEEYLKSNADKQITVLGVSQLLERMTFDGEPLKSKYRGRWNTLMVRLQRCLNRLSDVASTRRRNYIIDQINVFPTAQRRKLRPFEGFKRKAVLVINSDEEQAKRQSLKEEAEGKGCQPPDQAVLEMKANMVVPQTGDWVDEVVFAGLDEEEAKKQIAEYNKQGKAAGFHPGRPPVRQERRYDRHYNRSSSSSSYQNRNYPRYGSRGPPPRSGGWSHRSSGSSWNRDRRDHRSSSGNRDWMRNNRGPSSRPPPTSRNVRTSRPTSSSSRNHQLSRSSSNRSGGSWNSPGGGWVNSSGGGQWATQSGSWGGQSQNQWGAQGQWNSAAAANNHWQKYGGSQQNYGQQGYNWNYYGQYGQNWGGQGFNSTDRGTS